MLGRPGHQHQGNHRAEKQIHCPRAKWVPLCHGPTPAGAGVEPAAPTCLPGPSKHSRTCRSWSDQGRAYPLLCQALPEEQLWPEAQRWMRCPETEVMDIPGHNPAPEAPGAGVGGVKETSSAQGSTSTAGREHGEQEGRGRGRALTNAGERTLPDQRHGEGRGRGQLLLLVRLGEPADCV